MMCFPYTDKSSKYALVKRDERTAMFGYNCFNFDTDKWVKDGENYISEVAAWVSVRSGSVGDSILSKPRGEDFPNRVLYLRLE